MSVLPIHFVTCTLTLCIHWYIAVLIITFNCKLVKKCVSCLNYHTLCTVEELGSTDTGLSHNCVARHGPASVAHRGNATVHDI